MTHLVYGIDDRYLPPCLVSIYSVLKTASCPLKFTVFTSGPDAAIRSNIDRLSDRNSSAEFQVEQFSRKELAEYEKSEVATRFPAASMVPLFIPWLLDGKCLFLDADTLVRHDISELFRTDLRGHQIGACLAPTVAVSYRKHFSFTLSNVVTPMRSARRRRELRDVAADAGFSLREMTTKFFSSGVILMDTALIRNADPAGALMDLAGSNELWKLWPDMVRLNVHFKDKTHYLDLKWNVHRDFNSLTLLMAPSELRANIASASRDPGLLHYSNLFGRRAWRRPWFKSRYRYRLYRQVCEEMENQTGVPIMQMFDERR